MKTVFISSFHGYTGRNIFETDAFKILKERENITLVIFVLSQRRDYFQKHFGGPRVIVEGVAFPPPSQTKRMALVMKRIAKYGLDSYATRIEKRVKLVLEKRPGYFLAVSLLGLLLTRLGFASALLRRLMRWLDFQVSGRCRWRPYFQMYRPAAVLITDAQNERDVELAQDARRLKVPVVGIVRSWDNLTLHGLLRFLPELLLVPSQKVKEQAIAFNGLPAKRIRVVGIAHYDKYAFGPKLSKDEFCKELGLDPRRKIIIFAPIGDYYLSANDVDPFALEVVRGLGEQVIVRFSPSLEVAALKEPPPYADLVYDRPGAPLAVGERELSAADDDRLLHEFSYADVLVCGPSTLALDAAFFDKPTVLIGFHPRPRRYLEGILRRYDYDHFKFVLDCGAARLAQSPAECLALVKAYLKNPRLDAEGRARLKAAYAGPSDGRAGQRIARNVLQFLGQP